MCSVQCLYYSTRSRVVMMVVVLEDSVTFAIKLLFQKVAVRVRDYVHYWYQSYCGGDRKYGRVYPSHQLSAWN